MRYNIFYIPTMIPARFVAIDIEATGLEPEKDDIIEVALVRFENGEPVDSVDFLVKPKKIITSFIRYLTKITPKELDDAPVFKDIAQKLLDFIGNDPLVAHNANFDSKILAHAFSKSGIPVKVFKTEKPEQESDKKGLVFWDSLVIAQAAWIKESHKLTNLVSFLNITTTAAHRALPDAEACGKVFCLGIAELEKREQDIKDDICKVLNNSIYSDIFGKC